MQASMRAEKISLDSLAHVQSRYGNHVPDKLKELDKARYETIPKEIATRKENSLQGAHLTSQELEHLVEWKLKHGTFRPKLLALVSSNPGSKTEEITREAFAAYSTDPHNITSPLSTLTKLKGVGPATASLILSVYDPVAAPFFSDELFRYLHWEGPGVKGWSRVIKYTAKEYTSLNEKVRAMLERLGDGADVIKLEKAAYVLGKEKVDLGEGGMVDSGENRQLQAKKPEAGVAGEGSGGMTTKPSKKPEAKTKRALSTSSPPKTKRTHHDEATSSGSTGLAEEQMVERRSKRLRNLSTAPKPSSRESLH